MLRELTDDQLKELELDELIELAGRIERVVSARLAAEKRLLKQKLARIESYELSVRADERTGGSKQQRPHRRKAAPKYRDPSSGSTWSGRGMVPRWLAAAIAQGKERDDYLINPGDGQLTNGAHSRHVSS